MELFVVRSDPVFQFDLESLRDVKLSNRLVCSSREWIIDIISVEDLLHLLFGSTVLRTDNFQLVSLLLWILVVTLSEDINCHPLLLKLLRTVIILLAELINLLTA